MNWKYSYVSVIGASHLYNNSHCQDFTIVKELQDKNGTPYIFAALADGAGSAKEPRLGAEVACHSLSLVVENWLINNSCEQLNDEIVKDWVLKARGMLEEKASDLNIESLRDLASTLLFVLSSTNFSIFGQIGDGAIVVSSDSEFRCIFWPQSGEYANMTYFFTDTNFIDNLQIKIQEGFPQIAVFSDGLQSIALKYQEKEPFNQFFNPLFIELSKQESKGNIVALSEQLEIFLNSERINSRTDDDKSLILISST